MRAGCGRPWTSSFRPAKSATWSRRAQTIHPSNEIVDCHGRVLIPAFANVHHHFYSAFLRGAPGLKVPPRDQRERLERLVWPYEKTLDREDVRAAVRFGLLEAVVAGTTVVVDHHVSAGCVDGILDVIAEEISAAGVRAVLCYEITDRDGEQIARAGLRETERFLATLDRYRGSIKAMVGLHAMSTVGPTSLAAAVDLAQRHGVGIHLHVGEAVHDNDLSVTRFGDRPLARLEQAGGLNSQSLIAHAVHVTQDEISLLARRDVMVAHNPRSNASNGVGTADLAALKKAGVTVGIGGDGFTQDIWSELGLMTLLQRQSFHSPLALPPELCSRHWPQGQCGDYRTPLRLEDGNELNLAVKQISSYLTANQLSPLPRKMPIGTSRTAYQDREFAMFLPELGPILTTGRPTTLDEEHIRFDMRLRFPAVWERIVAFP